MELGRENKPSEAAGQFREAVRIMPDLIEARLNLGMALVNENKFTEAFVQFEMVLQQNPTNEWALRYAKALQQKLSPAQSH